MGGRDDSRDDSGRRGSRDDEYRTDRESDQYGGRSTEYGQGTGDQYSSQAGGGTYDQQGGRQGGYQQGSGQGGYEQGGRQGGHQQGGGQRGYQQSGHGSSGGYPNQGAGGYGEQPYLDTDVLGKRIGAHIIDNLLIFFLAIVLLLVVGMVGMATGPTTTGVDTAVGGLAILVGLGGAVFYLFLLEGYWDGQTVGKRAVNIRVVKDDGSQIGYAESVIRNFVEVFEGIFYYIPAIIVIAISDRDQRLGDHAASTLVIDDDPDPPRSPQGHQQQPPRQGQSHQQQPPQGQSYQQQPPRQQPQDSQRQSGRYQYSDRQNRQRDQRGR